MTISHIPSDLDNIHSKKTQHPKSDEQTLMDSKSTPTTKKTALIPFSLAKIRAVEQSGLDAGLPLMQRAGQAIADFVANMIRPKGEILVLAGPGNNGGDGLVAAGMLSQSGHSLFIWMPVTDPLPHDAHEALTSWMLAGGQVFDHLPGKKPALVIDGLFGIGLNRPLGSPWQEAIDTVNKWQVPVLSIDIPSGLEADTGSPLGRPILARWTLSLIAPTQALFSPSGKTFAGEVFVEHLGLNI